MKAAKNPDVRTEKLYLKAAIAASFRPSCINIAAEGDK